MNMRTTFCVMLAAILVFGAPWRAALADDGPGALPVNLTSIDRYGQFSHVPEPYAANDAMVCPECADLQADAGGGSGASSASTWLVIALIVIVVVAASSSDSGDGGGY